MDDVLAKIKELIAEIPEAGTVVIGENTRDIPASAAAFVIVREDDPAETYEYSGNIKRHAFHVRIRAGSAAADPFAEKAVMNAIALAKKVRGKLAADKLLGGLVTAGRLLREAVSVESAGGEGHTNKWRRVRELYYEFARFENGD
ncbi:MAG: hypothetical protein A2Y33_12305 [Spirochaetes bacterium GWF1_51_8]|nr:MAG: hypothetical protein A2Y33_12305 [Spirochaetes bacterium GWF1_51_8]